MLSVILFFTQQTRSLSRDAIQESRKVRHNKAASIIMEVLENGGKLKNLMLKMLLEFSNRCSHVREK